jgi:hypothetical protein
MSAASACGKVRALGARRRARLSDRPIGLSLYIFTYTRKAPMMPNILDRIVGGFAAVIAAVAAIKHAGEDHEAFAAALAALTITYT